MYSRQPMGRFPKGMRVPENYSGNAFATRPPAFPEEQVEAKEEEEPDTLPVNTSTSQAEIHEEGSNERSAEARPSFKLDLGRFFSGSRGFGMEDFLIIALILLLAQNDSSDDTLIFLILLLFIR